MSEEERNSDIDIDIDSQEDNAVDEIEASEGEEEDVSEMMKDEPTTPVPSGEIVSDAALSTSASIEEVLSKETRKLRKKKVFDSDDDSTKSTKAIKPVSKAAVDSTSTKIITDEAITIKEEDTIKSFDAHVPVENKQGYLRDLVNAESLIFTDEQVDHVDTDDLMDEVDRLPLLRKSMANKKKKKAPIDKKTRSSSSATATKKLTIVKTEIIQKYLTKKQADPYNPKEVKQLSLKYPDSYWKFDAITSENMIDCINSDNPLTLVPSDIQDQGAVTGMTLSDDGTMLVTFCNIGCVKIWDIRKGFKCLRHIRDKEEKQIDEFYCGQLLPGTGLLATGGKLKNRHRWSAEDNDNHILPCPIKIFDVFTGKRVAKLEGHTEEILCIKAVKFEGENYLISTSQDGYIIKWHMDKDWEKLIEFTPMIDGVTCMAFTVSFVPNTGNKYFLAACDEHLRLYDFEQAMLLQTFEDMYSSYCDCGKFVNWVDQPTDGLSDIEKQVDELAVTDDAKTTEKPSSSSNDPMEIDTTESASYSWFISRGAEMCDVSDGVSSKPNTCTLHKLVYPNKIGGKFELQTIKKYTHEDYHANSWLVKITSNGRYILAPTIYGQIFVFNMKSGQVSAVIKEHADIEVRDVIFHPYLPLIFSCSDDGFVKVYTYIYEEEGENQDEEDL